MTGSKVTMFVLSGCNDGYAVPLGEDICYGPTTKSTHAPGDVELIQTVEKCVEVPSCQMCPESAEVMNQFLGSDFCKKFGFYVTDSGQRCTSPCKGTHCRDENNLVAKCGNPLKVTDINSRTEDMGRCFSVAKEPVSRFIKTEVSHAGKSGLDYVPAKVQENGDDFCYKPPGFCVAGGKRVTCSDSCVDYCGHTGEASFEELPTKMSDVVESVIVHINNTCTLQVGEYQSRFPIVRVDSTVPLELVVVCKDNTLKKSLMVYTRTKEDPCELGVCDAPENDCFGHYVKADVHYLNGTVKNVECDPCCDVDKNIPHYYVVGSEVTKVTAAPVTWYMTWVKFWSFVWVASAVVGMYAAVTSVVCGGGLSDSQPRSGKC